MVHYIFSDKTGTLTQNIMEFKRFSVGATEYGSDDPGKKDYALGVTNVNFDDDRAEKDLQDPNKHDLRRFVEALGLCHTIITENKVHKETTIEGSN